MGGKVKTNLVNILYNNLILDVVEGINNKLQLIKRRGYGLKNFDNFSLRCF